MPCSPYQEEEDGMLEESFKTASGGEREEMAESAPHIDLIGSSVGSPATASWGNDGHLDADDLINDQERIVQCLRLQLEAAEKRVLWLEEQRGVVAKEQHGPVLREGWQASRKEAVKEPSQSCKACAVM